MPSHIFQDSEWTALFFALEGVENYNLKVFDYLLRSGRVDVSHKDKVSTDLSEDWLVWCPWKRIFSPWQNENTIVDIAKIIRPNALEILSKYRKAETV